MDGISSYHAWSKLRLALRTSSKKIFCILNNDTYCLFLCLRQQKKKKKTGTYTDHSKATVVYPLNHIQFGR